MLLKPFLQQGAGICNTGNCVEKAFVNYRGSYNFPYFRVFYKLLYQTPSPQKKKDQPRSENKLRLFLKRSSEPLLNNMQAQSSKPSVRNFKSFMYIIEESREICGITSNLLYSRGFNLCRIVEISSQEIGII